jgi:GMP synthase PP-ATPase subunit
VVLGLSGGVDSTVGGCFIASSDRQKSIFFVNNGLLRKNEFKSIDVQRNGTERKSVDAGDRFLSLAGLVILKPSVKLLDVYFLSKFF